MAEIYYGDGSADFSAGVDSSKVATVQGSIAVRGLANNQLSWLANGMVRGGGIMPRTGYLPLIQELATEGWHQGGYLYQASTPYLIVAVSGRILKALLDAPYTITDLSAQFGFSLPVDAKLCFFEQAEEFLIMQAGDGVTLPLFWDGNTLRRSNGLTGNLTGASVNELPAASCMCYYAGRLWFAQGRKYTAGDIVGGAAGTAPYGLRDSVLKVTENPLAFGGDGFAVPTNAGDIRALFYPANIDTALGQGPLLVGTRSSVYSLTVPVTRTDWINANSNQPLQVVAQIKYGPVGDRSVTHVNGDSWYQTMEPGIRSFMFARRNYGQWANIPISNPERRILGFNNREFLRYSSGINFDNFLYQTALPFETPNGIAHRALLPLDFDPIGAYLSQDAPVWCGHHEGLKYLQLFEGDFGGLSRAFAVTVPDAGGIAVWELTNYSRTDDDDHRVQWYVEFPAFTWAASIGEINLKQLSSGELHIDKLFGEASITVEFRADSDPCWKHWTTFTVCNSRSSTETLDNPDAYPIQPYKEGFRSPLVFPEPPSNCTGASPRPMNVGFQFQVRITVKGWLRIRMLILWAGKVMRALSEDLTCQ